MAEVFISYSSKDRERVMAFVERLQASGIAVWVDQRGIEGAHLWAQDIAEALMAAQVVVLMMSATSMASHNVVKEVALAGDENKHILPVRLEAVEVPTSMRYHLAGLQHLDLTGAAGADNFPTVLQCLADLGLSIAGVDQQRPPPIMAPSARPRHNLPSPPTPFIGREQEIAQWRELLLRPDVQLVTLLGFGGMGKSRSALRIAELCLHEFRDGAWWIELEEARDPQTMRERLAGQLEIQPDAKASLTEQLHAFLRERKLLLVLDNVEQIEDSGRVVNELLKAAANLKCLATSRRPLELRAEHAVEVHPLPATDAERLFVEYARAHRSEFEVTPENATDIGQLCRQLEAVPLALELAAARATSMSPREILNHLDQRFKLLQTRSPDLPARQRALHGAIDWSYDLLSDDDKSLFAQLSVFAGGFTLAEAEAVCETFDLFDGVESLRRQSLLLTRTDSGTQTTRFDMLVSLQQYAEEKLQACAEGGVAQQRKHAAHFLSRTESCLAQLDTADELRALDEIISALDNVRIALERSVRFGAADQVARLGLAMGTILGRLGRWSEAERVLSTGWEAAQRMGDAARSAQARLAQALAMLALDTGNDDEARARCEVSLALHRELVDREAEADDLNLLGLLTLQAGQPEEAQSTFEAALQLRAEGDPATRARYEQNLGLVALRRGDWSAARRHWQNALAAFRRAGDQRRTASALGDLGALAQVEGNLALARDSYLESLALHRRMRDRFGIAVMLNNLGELAEAAEPAGSEEAVNMALTLFVHAERLFIDLPSPLVSYPAESLRRLAERLGAERFDAIRADAESTPWEQVVSRLAGEDPGNQTG